MVYLKVKQDPERLCVHLGNFDRRADFNDALTRLKQSTANITGRRYNGETKDWEFPCDGETALRLMTILEPQVDAAVKNLIQAHQAEAAEALVTKGPEDARLELDVLNDILFPYQRAYVAWAMEHPHNLLADEMGIGKTVQAIAAVHERGHRVGGRGISLVVAPNGLRRNYRDTIVHGPRDQFGQPIYPYWPGESATILNGASLPLREKQLAECRDRWVITNWEKLRSDWKVLRKVEWSSVVSSEAHRAKNKDAQQTKALWKLNAPLMIAETGTPIMNSPGELWSILRWLFPDVYAQHQAGGGYWPFHYKYVDDYASGRGRVMRGVKNADHLRFELADKMIRRTKKQVLPDLPAKLPPAWVEVDFTKDEAKLYEEAETALFLSVRQYVADQPEEEREALIEELANLPLDRLERAIPNGGARIALLRQVTAGAKARAAVELIRENPSAPVVTFTWFVDPARWIADQLSRDKLRVGIIAGQGGDATSIANAFQEGETDQIVCTIAKGGVGLDLFRAHHAIFADRDWVPAINDQALDRLHRQGQKSDVSSTILYVPDTVDDGKVAPAERFKRAIVTEILGTDG